MSIVDRREYREADTSSTSDQRLEFLDSLRAIAALYVLAIHIHLEAAITAHSIIHSGAWNSFGPIAVGAFITLSGYCLTISITKSTNYEIKGGVSSYLKRRAKRILPTFYAAMILCLLILTARSKTSLDTVFWHNGSAAFLPQVLLAHLLLINNLTPLWACTIEYPMWSIAAETQLYLFFPLLIAITKRYGLMGLMNLALILSVVFTIILHYTSPEVAADNACLIILFALGITARFIAQSNRTKPVAWGGISIAALLVICILAWKPGASIPTEELYLLSGVVMLGALVYFTQAPSRLRSFLEFPPLVSLGRVSYSLYLTHAPILAVVHSILVANGNKEIWVLAIVGILSSLAFTYVFAYIFERAAFRNNHTPPKDHTSPPETLPLGSDHSLTG